MADEQKDSSVFTEWVNSEEGTSRLNTIALEGIPTEEEISEERRPRLLDYSERISARLMEKIGEKELEQTKDYFDLLRTSMGESENKLNLDSYEWTEKILPKHPELAESFKTFRDRLFAFVTNISHETDELQFDVDSDEKDYITYELGERVDNLFVSLLSPSGQFIGNVNQNSAIWGVRSALVGSTGVAFEAPFEKFYKGEDKSEKGPLYRTNALLKLNAREVNG